MSPNLHVEVLHSQHMHGACTTSVHIHALQRRIIISHKDFKFNMVDVSVLEILFLNVEFLKHEKCLELESNQRPANNPFCK